MKRILSTFFVLFVGPMLFTNNAVAYDDPPSYPVEPNVPDPEDPLGNEYFVKLVTPWWPGTNYFARNIDFCKDDDHVQCISIRVAFNRVGRRRCNPECIYNGTIYSETSKEKLASLADVDNFNYWDHVFFVNYAGSTTIHIDTLEVRVDDSEHVIFLPWESATVAWNSHHEDSTIEILYGYANARIELDTEECRIDLWEYYQRPGYTWNDLPESAQELVLDYGKFGTNATDDYDPNPQFGYPAHCSETISWYDYEHGESSFYNEFWDIIYWWEMAYNHFQSDIQSENRLYCWDAGRFIKTGSSPPIPTHPIPGDDFFWDDSLPGGSGPNIHDGHAMKIVSHWRDSENGPFFMYIDGPYPIKINKMYASSMTTHPYNGFCLGRIPEND